MVIKEFAINTTIVFALLIVTQSCTDLPIRGWPPAPVMTIEEQVVHDFATDQFSHIRTIVAPEDETEMEVKFVGHHIEVSSENWVYVLDAGGQQIFRPRAMFPHIEPSLAGDITPDLGEWMEARVPRSTVDEATRIAMDTLLVNYMKDVPVQVVTKRELIALKDLNSDAPMTHHEGRTRVLFKPEGRDELTATRVRTELDYDQATGQPIIRAEEFDSPLRSHETAITFAQDKVVRIDSVFMSPETQEVVEVFRDALTNGYIQAPYHDSNQMVLGTFFQKDEWRFEFSAHSWEGEDFITTSEPDCITTLCNPYDFAPIPYCTHDGLFDDPRVIFDHFRTTHAYRHEFWDNWDQWGRTGGVRGNCEVLDEATQTCLDWERDNWVIRHHNLGEYQWICHDPNTPQWLCITEGFLDWTFCNGDTTVYPRGGGFTMEDQFYSDLEDCHVVMLTAHGGAAFGIAHYQFTPYRDIWTYVHKPGLDGLGQGRLRHLFLASCAGMNWQVEEPELIQSWLNSDVADGIRSVFGTDGAYYASPYDEGLMFFHFYHNGDSVSDSWANMAMMIDPNNVPVGVGYGDNPFDALGSLLDQRFTSTRASNAVAAVLTLVD